MCVVDEVLDEFILDVLSRFYLLFDEYRQPFYVNGVIASQQFLYHIISTFNLFKTIFFSFNSLP